jgi:hypothetical protein
MRAVHALSLDALRTSFHLLTTGPAPLAVEGRRRGPSLPARPIPLNRLMLLLLGALCFLKGRHIQDSDLSLSHPSVGTADRLRRGQVEVLMDHIWQLSSEDDRGLAHTELLDPRPHDVDMP